MMQGGNYGRGRGRGGAGDGGRGRGDRQQHRGGGGPTWRPTNDGITPPQQGNACGPTRRPSNDGSGGNYPPQQAQGSVWSRGGPARRPHYDGSGGHNPPQQAQGSVWSHGGPARRPENDGSGGNYPPQQAQGSVWSRGGPARRPDSFGSGGNYPQQQEQDRRQGGGPAWGPKNATGAVAGEGGSGSNAATLRPSPASRVESTPGHVVPKMDALKISGGTSPSSAKALVPIQRPDAGGVKKIREINILVNHFPVEFNPQTVIRHYDIDVKSEAGSRPVKMSKATLSLLKDKLFADHPEFSLEKTAYDGEKNLFSVCSLPTGQFRVNLSDEDDVRHRSFIVSVTLVNELKLCRLKDYLLKKVLQLPRDVLQGLDVVMKEIPRRHMVSIGRTFHPCDAVTDLGYGLAASQGFQHSLKPTSQGLALCLDYSVLAVRKRISVLEFLQEHIYGFNINSFFRLRWEIQSALKGLKVTVTHRRTKQKYVVSSLTDKPACEISFNIDDPDGKMPSTSVRLLDYFRDKYPEVNIRHQRLPCLNLGKGGRVNYVPIELCVLVEGQRYPKEDLEFDAAAFLKKMSLTQPADRRGKICGMLQHEHGPCGGEISKNFAINVGMEMTRVKGRVINPPQIILGALDDGRKSLVNVDREKCDWNLTRNSFVEGKSLVRWAVLDLSCYERPVDRMNDQFISKLVARCQKLGLNMEKPLFTEGARMSCLASADSVIQLLDNVNNRARQVGKGNLQLLLCVMTKKHPGYKHIKWVSETKIGFITQCCIPKMANKGPDQYMANLGMKINAKLGGTNTDLAKPLTLFEDGSDVMVIGADVNHPRASDISSPSIAAVVASTNRRVATKYIPRVSFQAHRSEKIIGFGNLCWELIEAYEKINGRKPQRLVIFRDGVSEGQFGMVLNDELLDLKKVMQAKDYFPTVTLIVARKRHLTRLFPENPREAGRNGNVPPGTVVDKTIVHPSEFDFYLCSHYGMIGTSKPTLYQALWDEHNFSSDSLQEFIYNLCFTFARCCKPVSLVTPVYYADLLAYRGRLYYEALVDGKSSSGLSSSSGATSSSSTSGALFDESLYKLHPDIESGLYFV